VKIKTGHLQWFSVTVGEFIDVDATTKFALLVSGIDMESNITEELAALVPIKGTNYGCIFM
jgi:hypothetical protein